MLPFKCANVSLLISAILSVYKVPLSSDIQDTKEPVGFWLSHLEPGELLNGYCSFFWLRVPF